MTTPARDKLRYYDLARHWTKRVEPHLEDKKLNDFLLHDFGLYTDRWLDIGFNPGDYPRDFEQYEKFNHLPYQQKEPRFWRYVKWSACHYLANFNLRLAMLSEPTRPWRIITNTYHTTVWDGEYTMFDPNFLALEIDPMEFLSHLGQKLYALPVGEHGVCTRGKGVNVANRVEKTWRVAA